MGTATGTQTPRSGWIWSDPSGTALVRPDGDAHNFIEWVDPRDWAGFDVKGNNDNSTILQSAIDEAAYKSRSELGFGASKRLLLPMGRIAFGTQLLIRQNSWVEGIFGADGGTELRWVGADGIDAIANVAGIELSSCHLSNLRIKDFRTTPISGRGISFKDFNNGVSLRRLQVFDFPLEQIYVGADVGQAGDCTELDDIWIGGTAATAKGILLERLDNQVIVNNIKSDLATTPANDGYVIRTQAFTNDATVIRISNVKHESNNRCPTLSFPVSTRGNVSIANVIQRNPAGGAAGAGDIIQIGALAGGSAFAVDGTAKGWTTGATSESGGRMTIENVSGANHSDWTGASGAATIRMLGSATATYSPVGRATLGSSGRISRDLYGNSSPAGSVYGNVGDQYTRLDATASLGALWVKRTGNGANSGWAPMNPETQSVTYAAALSAVNMNLGNRIQVGALTGNITSMSNPTNMFPQGVQIIYELTQDGTGGRTIVWSSLHKGAWPTASGTPNQKKTVTGISDGTNIVFNGDSGWY